MKKIIFIALFFLFFLKSLFALDFGNYLAGESAYNNKNNKAAINFFENALELSKIDFQNKSEILETEYGQNVAQKLCSLYLLEGEVEKCINLGRKIKKTLDSDSLESTNILMALIVGDIKDKKLNSALNGLKKIKKSSYERFSVPIIESWLIAEETKSFIKAKKKLDDLEKDLVIDGLRNLNLALIHEYFQKKEEALKYYQKSMNAFSQPSYRLAEISSNAFERNRDFDKAEEIYTKFLNSSNDHLLVEKSLKRIESKKVPDPIINDLDDAIAELFSTIASTFTSDFTNNFSIVYSHFSLYLKNDFEVAKLYLAELYENNGNYAKANNLYEGIKPSSNFYWHTKLKKARNLELLGDNENSVLILKKMSKEKEERYDSLKLLGDISRNYKKYKQAVKFYSEGILRIKKIEARHWEIIYSRGMAYERNNQWDLAEKDFLKALDLVPDQPDVLNYLGYSWIEKKINLDDAKEFIIKAANIRPRDPYIVDSLGWAYFNLEEYDKAVKELEKAVGLKPTDPIINDHLGDAYFKVNRKLEALFQWKKAIEFNPETELKKEINKKIDKYDNNEYLDVL